jgi:hypothetical protein
LYAAPQHKMVDFRKRKMLEGSIVSSDAFIRQAAKAVPRDPEAVFHQMRDGDQKLTAMQTIISPE